VSRGQCGKLSCVTRSSANRARESVRRSHHGPALHVALTLLQSLVTRWQICFFGSHETSATLDGRVSFHFKSKFRYNPLTRTCKYTAATFNLFLIILARGSVRSRISFLSSRLTRQYRNTACSRCVSDHDGNVVMRGFHDSLVKINADFKQNRWYGSSSPYFILVPVQVIIFRLWN
jgi:hypothetical protein